MKHAMRILAIIVAAAFAGYAFAGDTSPFSAASKTYQIAVSNVASTPVQIVPNNPNFTGCVQYQMVNSGGQDAWVAFGTSSGGTVPVAATTVTPSTSLLVQAGTSQVVTAFQNAYVSAITAASTTTLNVSCGTGTIYGTTGILLGTGTSSTQVQGAGADGAATTGNPVLVGGTDGVNTQSLSVNSDGELGVQDGGNSLTVDAPLATPVHVRQSDGTDVANVEADGDLNVSANQNGTWNINNVSGTVSLPTGASTLAEQQTQSTSLSVLDDWDESDRAKVNLIAGQAGIAGGTGVDGATVPRVTLATDVALPAGTNNIGDVDVEIMGQAAVAAAADLTISADTTLRAASANRRILGWSIEESAASPATATVRLRHGVEAAGSCTGDIFAFIELDANQSATMWYGDRGIAVASGVCADIVAGTVSVTTQAVTEASP